MAKDGRRNVPVTTEVLQDEGCTQQWWRLAGQAKTRGDEAPWVILRTGSVNARISPRSFRNLFVIGRRNNVIKGGKDRPDRG